MALFYFQMEMKKMPHAKLLRECKALTTLHLKNINI
jgi:hypothetical protein